MKESTLANQMVRVLKSRGAWAFKTHGDPRQRRGLPDILACYKGRFIGIEVKVPGKEHNVTKLQEATLRKIREAKGISYVMSHVSEVRGLIDRIDEVDGAR